MRRVVSWFGTVSLLVGITAFAVPASSLDIEWVVVGNPGNASDTTSNCFAGFCGSVSYEYARHRGARPIM